MTTTLIFSFFAIFPIVCFLMGYNFGYKHGSQFGDAIGYEKGRRDGYFQQVNKIWKENESK